MPIVGIGTDICDIGRLQTVHDRHAERFAKRVLVDAELVRYRAHPAPVSFLAKRFAAKEAISKALGYGIGQWVSFHDIEIENDAHGAPQVKLSGNAKLVLANKGGSTIHLSLSDEKEYAVAFAIAE